MKNILLTTLVIITLLGLKPTPATRAQERPENPTFEYGIVKFESPDKVEYILPAGTEVAYAFNSGVKHSDAIDDPSLCLVWALNRLAKNGWQPTTLDANRALIRRAINQK